MDKKWGYCDGTLNSFCLKVPKNFMREPLSASENFWHQKNFLEKEGLCHDCISKSFCLTERKVFVREPFCAQNFSGSVEKLMDKNGERYPVFPSTSYVGRS